MSVESRSILLVSVPFFALTVVLSLLSDGVYHDDDLTHFLMARWSAWYPSYLLNIWGRPGLTVPLAAVASIGDREMGWHAARLLSAVVTVASAMLAARVAQHLNIRPPWLVTALCYLQPIAAVLGYTTLTENFAALYLIAAVALLQSQRPLLASAVFSFMLVTRHETAVLLPIWWLALCSCGTRTRSVWHRLIAGSVLSLWAPVLHNISYFAVFGNLPLRIFFEARGSTQYTAQAIWSYIPDALYAVPPAMAGLALIGALAMLRRKQWLIPAITATFFLTQVTIKALGVYGSGGYGRFMVVIAPFIAILCVAGLAEVGARLRDRRPVGLYFLLIAAVWLIGWAAFEQQRIERSQIWSDQTLWLIRLSVGTIVMFVIVYGFISNRRAGRLATFALAAFLLATCIVQWAGIVRPLHLQPPQELAQRTVQWLEQRGLADSPIFATDPWFAYFLNLVENPRAHKGARLLASMPVGTLFIWDFTYSQSDFHRLDYWTYRDDPHYELTKEIRWLGERAYKTAIFRKIASTPLPTTREVCYPPVPDDPNPVLGIYYIRAGRH